MLAAIRPDSWNFPLLLHVLGAALVVAVVALVAAALLAAIRSSEPPGAAALMRFGYRWLLIGAIPTYLVMRVGAEWVADEENLEDPAWIGIGYAVADGGLLFLIIATVAAGMASRRLAREPGPLGTAGLLAAGFTLFVLAANVVALWAMTAKPT